jgi:biotin operon repressor
MTYFEYAQKLDTIKELVRLKQAGTPFNLSKKLNVSERTVLRMVQYLKDNGYPITFNRFRESYELST